MHGCREPRSRRVDLGWAIVWLLALAAAAAQPVAVIEDDAIEQRYESFVNTSMVKRALHRGGLRFERLRAGEITAGRLARHELVVLPSNPTLGPAAIEQLRRYTARGGKLVVFPEAPVELARLVGVAELGPLARADDRTLPAIRLDDTFLPSLPPAWQQFSWHYQRVTAAPEATVLGVWESRDPGLQGRPVVTLSRHGAFIGAVPKGDDRTAEAQLLLALATWFNPYLWHQALPHLLGDVGNVGDAASLAGILRQIDAAEITAEQRRQAREAWAMAKAHLAEARRLYAVGQRTAGERPAHKYLPVVRLGWAARDEAEQAYYHAQPSGAGEFVGVWLQQAGDLREWGWERTIRALQENNVDAIFVNVVNAGYANYPSEILPHVTAEGYDALDEVLSWCRALGIECHVWMMVNYLRPLTPPDHLAELRAEGRLQVNHAGEELPWLRPGDPRNVAQVAAVAQEIASRYAVDGLHLDYARYAHDADFSSGERTAFESELREPVARWPEDVALGAPRRANWVRWRQAQVNAEVEAIATAARSARPGIKMSAAVYPIWADAKYAAGQDAATWARRGWVDFLCPMNYHTNDTAFFRYLRAQQQMVGNQVPLYPGIAAWRQETPADTISQIRQLRSLNMPGYVLFHLDRRLAREWLPALHLGVSGQNPWLGPAVRPRVASGGG